MHPGWLRLGGVAEDLPEGWEQLIGDFIAYLTPRLDEYDALVLGSRITKARAKGIGPLTTARRSNGASPGPTCAPAAWSGISARSGPTRATNGSSSRCRSPTTATATTASGCAVEEIRQSLRIIAQCLEQMPGGPYKSHQPLATPPVKEPGTMHHIETLIDHFLGVSWGPVIPPGEACLGIEATKGNNGYYLVSDGTESAYRNRIRSPSFPHLQVLPLMAEHFMIPDLITILGSIDFVMADVDR